MLDPKKVRLGICPIGWSNDDMWDLGDENTFQQCISEMKLAGFDGCEVGHKYPGGQDRPQAHAGRSQHDHRFQVVLLFPG